MSERTEVKPGQVWADNDKRSVGREVLVLEVDSRYAYVQQTTVDRWGRGNGRKSRILLERMRPTSTGYRLVKDVSGGAS